MSERKHFPSLNIEDYQTITPMELMLKDFEVPDGLEEKIIAAMAERRAENKQKEAEQNALRKKISRRVAAVVAILLFTVATPVGHYVAYAASEAYEYVAEYIRHLFSLKHIEVSASDYSVEEISTEGFVRSQMIDIGDFEQSIDVSHFNIEFKDFVISNHDLVERYSSENRWLLDDEGQIKEEFLTHIDTKVTYDGKAENFGKYTPLVHFDFLVSIQKDSKEIGTLYFFSGVSYSEHLYHDDGTLQTELPCLTSEFTLSSLSYNVSLNIENLKAYEKTLSNIEYSEHFNEFENINSPDEDFFNIMRTLQPDSFVIKDFCLYTETVSGVEMSKNNIASDNDDYAQFETPEGMVYFIRHNPEVVNYVSEEYINRTYFW